ncbi:MAG: hypothetical protein E2O92_03840 [Alphaproteobacteria bacterium]|nr:MAG: hypothetical protein E2O92_03840 [Alphaproteobacteria bacterium]
MPTVKSAALIMATTCLLLMACEERFTDTIVEACINDGQPMKYCECTAKGMKAELGEDGYVIFTDMIVLSGNAAPSSTEIIAIMEKHGLAPELLSSIRQSIESAAKKVFAFCRR